MDILNDIGVSKSAKGVFFS